VSGLLVLSDVVQLPIAELRHRLRNLQRRAALFVAAFLPFTIPAPDVAITSAGTVAPRNSIPSDQAVSKALSARPVASQPENLSQFVTSNEASEKPTGSTTAARPNARRATGPIEDELIGGAQTALKEGTLEGMVRARQLLEEHRQRFPYGRLAAEREALWHQCYRAR
jgi:hypothetical protein